MKRRERRAFLRNTGLAITAAALSDPLASAPANAQTSKAAPPSGAPDAPTDVTQKLVRFIASARYEDLPGVPREMLK
jgi:hypothetical protein